MTNHLLKILILSTVITSFPGFADGQESSQWFKGAFRVNTEVSAGRNNFSDIANIAIEEGIDFVVFTDQFIVRGEYGIPPFRDLIKFSKERRSISTYGIDNYLNEIKSTQSRFPEVILIPGADVAPIYEITGSLRKSNFEITRWSQQITVLGSDETDFYRNIPAIHNDKFGVKFPDTIINWLPLILVMIGIRLVQTGIIRYTDQAGNKYAVYERFRVAVGSVLAIFSLVWLVNNRPLTISRYSQYKENGLTPFQDVFDYVHDKGGLAFWSHPEIKMLREFGPFIREKYGKVLLNTAPYLNDVISTFRHNGLAGLYGDMSTAHHAGAEWDHLLSQYCRGERKVRPVVIGEVDYHADRRLDFILTVVQADEKSQSSILNSLKNGSSYAIGGAVTDYFQLVKVLLSTDDKSAGLGETLITDNHRAKLHVSGEWTGVKKAEANLNGTLYLIINGKLAKTITVSGPSFDMAEEIQLGENENNTQYVRFNMLLSGCNLVANPIFIEKPK